MKEYKFVQAVPEKRIFWSIISDYGLKSGVCELIDNAIDIWIGSQRDYQLIVEIEIDVDQQIIKIIDNSGGVSEANLPKLVTPGGSQNDPNSQSIGIFGVGSKRAGVALGQVFSIKTRYKSSNTFLMRVDDDWLKESGWDIPVYKVSNISKGSTEIEISHLRSPISNSDVEDLNNHLSSVYGIFLSSNLILKLNGEMVKPVTFDKWAYPPEVMPRKIGRTLNVEELGLLDVSIEAGLITDRDAEAANYGFYLYCNDRLILRHWKDRAVGYFIPTEAGVPHPDASLARVILTLRGPARAMPWNSSKDGINTGHKVFKHLQADIVTLVGYYTKASRRWKKEWDAKVYTHTEGSLEYIQMDGVDARLRLPPAPKGTKHYVTSIKDINSGLIKRKPWVLGLIEAMAAYNVLLNQNLSTKNRIGLVLLDSNLEISFKEYIVNNREIFPSNKYTDEFIKNIFGNRSSVIDHVSKHVSITSEERKIMESFYLKRNKMIHERASVDVSGQELEIYKGLVESILRRLFGIRFPAS